MPLILDTMNVLHTVGVLPPDLAGLEVPALASLIRSSRYRGQRVTFVCDGLPGSPAPDLPPPGPLALPESDDRGEAERFLVRYAGASASADDVIRDLVDGSTAPRRLTVVSSDHQVQRHARRRRCAVLSSQEFLQHLADDAHLATRRPGQRPPSRVLPPAMSPEQVEKWISVFDVDEQAIAQSLQQPEPEPRAQPDSPKAPADSHQAPQPLPGDPPPPNPLPAELIAQAELLLLQAQPPAVGRAPGEAEVSRGPRGLEAPGSLGPRDTSDDLANLDMNDILPADGRTLPLRKRGERNRPPGGRESP